jgi:hypothetical protein
VFVREEGELEVGKQGREAEDEGRRLTERNAEEGLASPFTWGAILEVVLSVSECGMWFLGGKVSSDPTMWEMCL